TISNSPPDPGPLPPTVTQRTKYSYSQNTVYPPAVVVGAEGRVIPPGDPRLGNAQHCLLGSHQAQNWTGIQKDWGARTWQGKNILGWVLVDLGLTAKQAVIDCAVTVDQAGKHHCTATCTTDEPNGDTHGFGYCGWTAGADRGIVPPYVDADPVNP